LRSKPTGCWEREHPVRIEGVARTIRYPGRYRERFGNFALSAQVERIKGTLSRREKIATQISKIQETVAALSREVADQAMNIDFEHASGTLQDGMNTYLNSIEAIKPQSWTQEAVNVRMRERAFRFAIGRSDWKAKLGGTLTLYFLLSYHYSLMTLTAHPEYHYPVLVILDFPAELEDATSVKDKENFVLEPFVHLVSRPGMESLQLIAAGSAFEDLIGAHRIELTRTTKRVDAGKINLDHDNKDDQG